MSIFRKLGNALKAPLKPINKAVGAIPGMKSASAAMPGGGMMSKATGIGPSLQAMQGGGLGSKMQSIAQPQPMQSAPPMGDANMLSLGARNPQQPFPGGEQDAMNGMQAPDSMGVMPQPMNPPQEDPAAMMAKRMQSGGLGPSFGQQQDPRKMGMMGRVRRMM